MSDGIAIVTGAGGSIGGACALALAATHDAVLCVDRDGPSAQASAARITGAGGTARIQVADAEAPDFAAQVVDAATQHGPVRTVVHALAYEEHRAALHLTPSSVVRSFAVGPLAAFTLFQRLVLDDALAPDACLIAIGSLHERQPFANCLGYNAAHAALGQVVRTLAHEWSGRSIRVNAVIPGWIHTTGEAELYGEAHLRQVAPQLPLGRFGTPEDVACAVAYLASEAARYVSGTFLTVDGALGVSLAQLPGGSAQ
jgi:NAD(P)-dependent dehydrogenase (short-subunit alcohol dehydrogenase family)